MARQCCAQWQPVAWGAATSIDRHTTSSMVGRLQVITLVTAPSGCIHVPCMLACGNQCCKSATVVELLAIISGVSILLDVLLSHRRKNCHLSIRCRMCQSGQDGSSTLMTGDDRCCNLCRQAGVSGRKSLDSALLAADAAHVQ